MVAEPLLQPHARQIGSLTEYLHDRDTIYCSLFTFTLSVVLSMPEPLTILSAAFGSFNFLVALRNVVWTIANDVDAYREHKWKVPAAQQRLSTLHTRLRAWLRHWRIHEGVRLHLFIAYWGPDGSEVILDKLRFVRAMIKRLLDDFEKKLKEAFEDLEGSAEFLDSANWSYSGVNEQRRFNQLQSQYAGSLNPIRKLVRSMLTDKFFDMHLNDATQCMEDLHQSSVEVFLDYHELSDEDQRDHRELVASREHVASLSLTVPDTIVALSQSFQAEAQHYNVDLRLDYGKEHPSLRLRKLEAAAAEGVLPFYFVYSASDESSSDVEVNIRCQKIPQRTEVDTTHYYESFSSAANQLMISDAAHLRSHKDGTCFRLDKDFVSSDRKQEDRKTLQAFLSAQTLAAQSRDPKLSIMDRDEKIQLAYQLAEWVLFTHSAESFTDFCCCRLYRTEAISTQLNHRVRIGPSDNNACSMRQRLALEQTWCNGGYPSSPVRRLNLMLTEIGLGYSLDLEDNPREVNRKIAAAMQSQDYIRAIEYCRRQAARRDTMSASEVRQFRRSVVEPYVSWKLNDPGEYGTDFFKAPIRISKSVHRRHCEP